MRPNYAGSAESLSLSRSVSLHEGLFQIDQDLIWRNGHNGHHVAMSNGGGIPCSPLSKPIVDRRSRPEGTSPRADHVERLAVRVSQPVDLSPRALLGHGDQYAVGQLGIPAAQWDPAVVAKPSHFGQNFAWVF